jgi:sulfatase maturation enzyme AslB (radical SAM superfamily)
MINTPQPATGPARRAATDRPTIEMVVLQPTAFCNIACAYCYLPSRDQCGVMEQETVRCVFERIFESGYAAPELAVIWHAGEPLAAANTTSFRVLSKMCRTNPAPNSSTPIPTFIA